MKLVIEIALDEDFNSLRDVGELLMDMADNWLHASKSSTEYIPVDLREPHENGSGKLFLMEAENIGDQPANAPFDPDLPVYLRAEVLDVPFDSAERVLRPAMTIVNSEVERHKYDQ